jgi:hypothetical protein
MGKYERDWVEEAEKAVSDSINGISQDLYIMEICNKITNFIDEKYTSKINYSEWVGGDSYEDPGDVHVFLNDNTKVLVELKFSFSNGSGTKANPSTTVLKKKINENIKTYPEVDQELGLKQKRYQLVSNYVKRDIVKASDYGKALRAIRDSGNESFIESIASITAPGQEYYAKYAAEQMNQNLNSVNKWVSQLLAGNNTTKISTQSENVVYCVIKNFKKKNQIVEFHDFNDMDSVITNVVSSGKSIKLQNSAKRDVIRMSVTWKNICQGGKTPCFNVFVGNAYN